MVDVLHIYIVRAAHRRAGPGGGMTDWLPCVQIYSPRNQEIEIMDSSMCRRLFSSVLPMLLATVALAQQEPGIGYVYPAGGLRGTTVEVVVGGQFLTGVDDVVVSGDGIQGTVVEHTKPLTQRRINDLRQKFQEIAKELQGNRGDKNAPIRKFQSAGFCKGRLS